MTSVKTIENKISSVNKYLKTLKNYQKLSQETIVKDIDKKGAVERYLYLAVQAAIDLADTFVSYKKYSKPSSMSDIFYILQEEKIIGIKLTEKMVKMTGFRNIMAHDYEKVDYNIVYNVLKNDLKDVKKFVDIIEKKI